MRIPLLVTSVFYLLALTLSGQKTFQVAFGSCGHQNEELKVFSTIANYAPDVFVFLGDNIYADTEDMAVMRSKYQKLGNNPYYNELKRITDIVATWDDHDFGVNDGGKHYPKKNESKELFLEFFEEPKNSPRRNHEGIYISYMYSFKGYSIQLILLDLRTFRDDLNLRAKTEPNPFPYSNRYNPHTDTSKTITGETQWKWLEEQVAKNSDVTLIGTSTQFGITYNGYEAWANFPHEQQRLVNLIQKLKKERVIFLSGDVHYAEISKYTDNTPYPFYDITSSGLSSTWEFATDNTNRVAGPYMPNHFGLLEFTKVEKELQLTVHIKDVKGNSVITYPIDLKELTFR